MRKLASLALCAAAVSLGLAACEDDEGTGPDLEQFVATLTGANEVPANSSTATGSVVLTINTDNTVSWTMDLNGIRNMTANLLIPTRTITETLTGRVASGSFGPTHVNNMSYTDLLAAIRSGNVYVNVHTSDGVNPANTGMGDFPGGEIRGQTAPMP